MTARTVLVPPERFARWVDNFAGRHGLPDPEVVSGALRLTGADDGVTAVAELPFGRSYAEAADVPRFAEVAATPVVWGILLVRKGGFAVAALDGTSVSAAKVGKRHVQGRTKAGGQSQQRFARRRQNQARDAYAAAAEHAARILVTGSRGPEALVCGGDRAAVEAVLADPRLRRLADVRTAPWLPVADPRRSVLDAAVIDARSLRITLDEPG